MNALPESLIRIVILDSHTLVRAGLKLIINSHPGMKVIGEAGESKEGAEIVTSLKPDIILLTLDTAGNLSLEIIRELSKASSRSRIILLTQQDETQINLRAVQEGVLGVVFTTHPPETLIRAIQKVHAGEAWLERSMIANLISGMTNHQQLIAQDPVTECIAQLSPRERKVIQLIGQGYKNSLIAKQLCISETTVRHHLTSIYSKVGVSDRLELLVFVHRNNLD